MSPTGKGAALAGWRVSERSGFRAVALAAVTFALIATVLAGVAYARHHAARNAVDAARESCACCDDAYPEPNAAAEPTPAMAPSTRQAEPARREAPARRPTTPLHDRHGGKP